MPFTRGEDPPKLLLLEVNQTREGSDVVASCQLTVRRRPSTEGFSVPPLLSPQEAVLPWASRLPDLPTQ